MGAQFGLGRYYGLLHAEGFDDFRIIRGAAEEDVEELIALCAMPRLHAKQFRRALLSLEDSPKAACTKTVDASTHVAGRDDTSESLDNETIQTSVPMSQTSSLNVGEESAYSEGNEQYVESTERGFCQGAKARESQHDLENMESSALHEHDVDGVPQELDVNARHELFSFDSEE